MNVIQLTLIIAALVVFIIAALNVAAKLNLIAVGLALLTLVILLGRAALAF